VQTADSLHFRLHNAAWRLCIRLHNGGFESPYAARRFMARGLLKPGTR
jgi:hypothetical protein